MTSSLLEPACPGADSPPAPESAGNASAGRPLRAERRDFASLDPATWDRLARANPWATPFSRHAFHQAWWDAYGESAHDQTLVVLDPDGPADAPPVGIAPLMHRHEVEPTDAERQTTMRHHGGPELTPVEPHAKAVFFGASYHADYATLLAAPADLAAVSAAVVDHLADPDAVGETHPMPWDVVDLRRLRCGDPAAEALAVAFGRREMAAGWTLNVEREDVCPVVTLPQDGTFDDYLGTLGKKARHEIRRKLRRAEAAGEVVLDESSEPLAELDAFIDLHQRRWGEQGLFKAGPGGDASRVFLRRMFELLAPDGTVRLTFLRVGDRRIAAGIHLETHDGYLYYNAGVDPDARDLSPGVVMVARYVERAIAAGKRRLDFLRGDEPYKYDWGAVDEPIQRLLVRRPEER
ncbi:MAG TPA: GNAT family N-acetyltransferase [Vitreimonas sp.]|nr:GNAT family N-acetyltransferase [Vitreimonas sp.]